MRMRGITGCLLGTAALLGMTGVANAAPTNTGFVLTFTCNNGQTLTLVDPPGHATWTPGITVGGVLKPVAFNVVETVYNADGSVASVNSGDTTQANGVVGAHNPNAVASCENVSTFTSDQDPHLQPGQSLEVDLTITGILTGTA